LPPAVTITPGSVRRRSEGGAAARIFSARWQRLGGAVAITIAAAALSKPSSSIELSPRAPLLVVERR
jgi:hypothetical protein